MTPDWADEKAREIAHGWIRDHPSLAVKMMTGPKEASSLSAAIAAALREERERCAKVLENLPQPGGRGHNDVSTIRRGAAAIRGETP